jgi:hypothetical protein
MLRSTCLVAKFCAVTVAMTLAAAVPSHAQRGGRSAPEVPPEVLRAQQEQADFNNIAVTQDTDKKIKLIGTFLGNYPDSTRKEAVFNLLVNVYYSKQDWDNFYASADKTIAAYPDDVDVLTMVGWVIPHAYSPSDPDAAKKLDKAEAYEKHAIELIPDMHKPVSVTDDQFATAKAEKLSQAHSGLGLVYSRRRKWDDSAKELQQATSTATSPDQTDLYALAFALQQLQRYTEAADAYDKCSLAVGILQDRCKQAADNARTLSLQLK